MVALLYLYGVGSVLLLYPAAELYHALMILPIFLPLLAHQLDRFHGTREHRPAAADRLLSGALISALLLLVAAPTVHEWVAVQSNRPRQIVSLDRASSIWAPGTRFSEGVTLVQYLRSSVPRPQSLLVLANEQLIYFLTAMPSALEKDEFLLYLIEDGHISQLDAHRLMDQGEAIARVEARKPVIVDDPSSRASRTFREMLPQLARYIAAHYHATATIGRYRILAWNDEAPHGGAGR